MSALEAVVALGGLALMALTVVVTSRPEQPPVKPPPDVAALIETGQANGLDFFYCPSEERRRPHAVGVDGSRTCWHCGHDTPGDRT